MTNGGPSITRSPFVRRRDPVLEYRSKPASRAAASTRSVTWCPRAERRLRLARSAHELDARPSARVPRTSPTDGSSVERRRAASSGAARPGARSRSTRSSSIGRSSVAWATAAPTPLCDQVNPCTKPVCAHRLEHLARTLRRTRTGSTRSSSPSPPSRRRAGRPSGPRRTIGPVRPKPVIDLVGDQQHAVPAAHLGDRRPVVVASGPPRASVAPATGSAMNAATVDGPACAIARSRPPACRAPQRDGVMRGSDTGYSYAAVDVQEPPEPRLVRTPQRRLAADVERRQRVAVVRDRAAR